jgi:hypothetical protein
MYTTSVSFGSIDVTVEAQSFRDLMAEVDMLLDLGQDAEMLADHIRFFHDAEPKVRPRVSDDDDNNMYRGFICENTGCNITFKEDQDGAIYPGRYSAYDNGQSNPKLYDPSLGPEDIAGQIDESTDFVQRHGVRLPQGGSQSPRGQQQPQGNPRGGNRGQQPQGNPPQNQPAPQGTPRGGGQSRGNAPRRQNGGQNRGAPGR